MVANTSYLLLPAKIIHLDDKFVNWNPLNWRTRNHVQSMYIGVFTLVRIFRRFTYIKKYPKRKRKFVLIFKVFHANFFKRAEQDVIFICKDGAEIVYAVQQAVDKGNGLIYRLISSHAITRYGG
ncbi:MAG: hypothetical protein CM1200mP10_05630 [Candidatus Neomarinimicrobiota bacterium]|nr:MAG: hypothetical protein CM1200mP10_05630 [Candidatus Neomarinimicrobiota bacterium]